MTLPAPPHAVFFLSRDDSIRALVIAPAAPDAARLALIVLAAAAGGAVNSIAGGGTLLTFPALLGLGVPAIVANATSTVALWPGTIGSIWGYRGVLAGARAWAIRFAIPSLVGGLVGSLLLLRTSPETFDFVVPWLVLGATLLFVVQRPIMRRLRPEVAPLQTGDDAGGTVSAADTPHPSLAVLLFQFAVAVYGGYFGAGIGILMLAALGFMGFRSIHRMNGLKNWGGMCINLVAAITFSVSGLVDWPIALAMAAGATVGGYVGSRVAQRVSQERVRQTIIAIGFVSALLLMWNRL